MAWETRGRQRVYYRARRVGGKVRKQYFGSGIAAQVAASEDKVLREQRGRERATIRAIKATVAPLGDLMRELDDGVRVMYQASLLAAGYHDHRGTWRKRRDRQNR